MKRNLDDGIILVFPVHIWDQLCQNKINSDYIDDDVDTLAPHTYSLPTACDHTSCISVICVIFRL